MAILTMVLGVLLVALGGGTFAAADKASPTALIPAYVGVVFLVLGVLATRPAIKKHAMHAAAALGLLIALGGLGMGVPKAVKWMNGTPPATAAKQRAVVSQVVMGTLSAGFTAACVGSFVRARRDRAAAAR